VRKFKIVRLPSLVDELKKLVFEFLNHYESINLLQSKNHLSDFNKPNVNCGNLLDKESVTDFLFEKEIAHFDFKSKNYSFRIGNVKIYGPVIAAPLAGISDNTYRIFARFFGAALTYTEMVTSYGIYYKHKKSLNLANITDYERPCALQIFGSDPGIMAEAAGEVEEKADIIDINMGCPVPKILKARSGGYLLQDEAKVEKIITKLSSVLKKPLTIKTRIGWDSSTINILNIAKIAESSGASAITIHGRTVKQGFSGKVDYELIKKVKEKVKIPVIVSGDINYPARAREVLDYTGCDGIMIGRAAKGRLWLMMNVLLYFYFYEDFRSSENIILSESFDPDVSWKKEFSKLYLKFLIYFKGEDKGVREFRKHLSWIFKGTKGISKVKNKFFKISNFKEALNCIDNVDNVLG